MGLLNEFKMKNVFIIFLLIITLSGCLPEKKKVESDAIRVVIADRVFKVPKGYLDGAPAYGKDNEALVIEYSLPGFEVLPHRSKKKERYALINASRMMGMLLENATSRPEFTPIVKRQTDKETFVKKEKLFKGLEWYVYNPPPKPLSFKGVYSPTIWDDILVDRNKDGTVNSYLQCRAPKEVSSPTCIHRFIDKGLMYQIRWATRELPNWKEQQQTAIAFIDSMERNKEEGK